MKKRLLTLLLAMLSTLSLCACEDGNWDDLQQDDVFQTLQDYYGSSGKEDASPALTGFALPYLSGKTADPITCIDGAQHTLGTLLYEPLYQLDPQLNPQPFLAESHSYSASKRTYTITLREDITFSDGSSLSAKDVVYSLERAMKSQRYSSRLAEITSVSGKGTTVTIKLSVNNASFLFRLDIPIIKYGTGGRTYPIGSGPYCYRKDDTGAYLSPNENWWQDKSLPLERIDLVRCKDYDTMAYAFYSRDIQLMMYDLTATSTTNVYGSGSYTDAATTTMQFIGINTTRAPLNDASLRAALQLGVDRSNCISAYLLGHGKAAQFPLSPVSDLYPHQLEVPYSPDYFDTAMAEAGYSKDKPIRLTLLVNKENSFKVDAAKQIAADLSQHDLHITVKAVSWKNYLAALQAGDFDLYYGECKLTADWDLRSLLSTGGSLNYGLYSDAQMDALISAMLSAPEEDRPAAAQELYSYFAQQCPILPICFKDVSVLLPADAVEGIVPTAANPFYNLPQWNINIALPEEVSE